MELILSFCSSSVMACLESVIEMRCRLLGVSTFQVRNQLGRHEGVRKGHLPLLPQLRHRPGGSVCRTSFTLLYSILKTTTLTGDLTHWYRARSQSTRRSWYECIQSRVGDSAS